MANCFIRFSALENSIVVTRWRERLFPSLKTMYIHIFGGENFIIPTRITQPVDGLFFGTLQDMTMSMIGR